MNHQISTIEINKLIYNIRGKAVMLDSDLSKLYGVETRVLNQSVRRNNQRFPEDFMIQLTIEEMKNLMSQTVISSSHGGKRKPPLAFTEQGVAMLSSVLNSENAIQVNINIMRAFVQVKRLALTILDIRRKIDGMERKYDQQFKVVFDAIRQLLNPPTIPKLKRKMGFGLTVQKK